MTEVAGQSKKGIFRQIGELGPAWITAAGGFVVALTGAGFFVGHATASPAPQPAVTVTKTVLVGGQAGASAPPGSSAGGTQLASYPVNLPPGYSVPLGVTSPTQSQFLHLGSLGDLELNTSGLVGPGTNFLPLGGDKIILLPSGSAPTYGACSTGTGFVSSLDNTTGAAFCLIEGTGKVAGISVSSIDSAQPYYSVLQVTIWQGAS